MGSQKDEGALKKFLKKLPGGREGKPQDKGNTYEFEATIGQKGDSLGLTFDKVSQILAKIEKGMKARVIMKREPGSSIFTARLYFIHPEEERDVSRAGS